MNRFAFRFFGAFLIAFLTASSGSLAPANEALALTHVTVIDGYGGPPQPDMTVVILGERIADIFHSGRKQPPAGAKIMDLRGHFVMPGLIDSGSFSKVGLRVPQAKRSEP